nr:hypothetical protein VITISV_030863 [Tanacetum cinerariifolium]
MGSSGSGGEGLGKRRDVVAGRNVESDEYDLPKVVNDGVRIAGAIVLLDAMENLLLILSERVQEKQMTYLVIVLRQRQFLHMNYQVWSLDCTSGANPVSIKLKELHNLMPELLGASSTRKPQPTTTASTTTISTTGFRTYLLAFIHAADPTKVRIVERERAEGEAKLLDSIVGCVVSLLPVALARAESELEASVEKLFDEGGSTKQVDFAVRGGHDAEIKFVTAAGDTVIGSVAAERPKPPRKKRPTAMDASGSSHPPKKPRGDYETSSDVVIGGKSLSALKELLSVIPPSMTTKAVITTGVAYVSPVPVLRFTDKVIPQTEYCLSERKRLESECGRQADLLKSTDEEVENLKAQLLVKEAEAAETARLRAHVSAIEAAEKCMKVMELRSLVSAKDRELNDFDVTVTSLKDTQPNITKLDPKSLKCVFLGYSRIQKGYRCYCLQLHRYPVSRDVTFHEDLPYFPVTTYRHQEENDDLLVYVSATPVETTKQSAELDGLPLKVYARRPRIRSDLVREPSTQLKYTPIDAPNNVSNDAPNDVSNDVPISTPSEACGKSDSPSDAPSGFDSPSPSPTPELDLPIALRKALAHSGWHATMIKEMNALDHNNEGYAQTYGINYSETFSLVAKISSIWFFISLAATYDWALYQLDVKNSFLHGCILLVVYVNDIVITGSDKAGIKKLKSFIGTCFQTKDLGSLKNLLGIEVSHSSKGICLSQRKYCLDLLDDASQIEAKPYDEPMIPKLKLRSEDGRLLHNPEKYRQVVRKLNYLTITHPNIAFPVSVVSQFLTAPRTSHWDAITQILGYLNGTLGLGILYSNHGHHIAEGFRDADYAGCPNILRSTTGYCVFVEGNLVSWKSKKQNVVSRSSLDAEYRTIV